MALILDSALKEEGTIAQALLDTNEQIWKCEFICDSFSDCHETAENIFAKSSNLKKSFPARISWFLILSGFWFGNRCTT